MKCILYILISTILYSSTSLAQIKDTIRLNTVDLVDNIAFNANVNKLLFSGYRITGAYSYSAFNAVKDFKTGKVAVVPTYVVNTFPGYTLHSGSIYGWIDDQHVLIKQTNLPVDSIKMWAAYNVLTMECEDIRLEHEIKLNDDILVDDGAIVYMPYDASGAKNVYRYDFYTKKTSLYHTFNEPGYVILKAFSNTPDRLFYYSAATGYTRYLDDRAVKEIPKAAFGKRSPGIKILRYNFRYDDKKNNMYFITKVSKVTDTINNMTVPQAYLINQYDFQTGHLNTLDTIPISRENYWDIRGFEIFQEGSLLLSVEKRLTADEEERMSIEGPVIETKLWDINVTLPTRLNTQKYLIKLSIE